MSWRKFNRYWQPGRGDGGLSTGAIRPLDQWQCGALWTPQPHFGDAGDAATKMKSRNGRAETCVPVGARGVHIDLATDMYLIGPIWRARTFSMRVAPTSKEVRRFSIGQSLYRQNGIEAFYYLALSTYLEVPMYLCI